MPATRPTLTATRLTALSYTLHATAMCLMPATRPTLTATCLTALSYTLHVSPSQPLVWQHWATLYMQLLCTAVLAGRVGGWVGVVCTWLLWMPFGSFSLRQLTCRHCADLALRTCKVLLGRFHAPCINVHSFIHFFLCFFSVLLCPLREIWVALPGQGIVAARAALPIPITITSISVHGTLGSKQRHGCQRLGFLMRMHVNARRGCTDTVRESALQVVWIQLLMVPTDCPLHFGQNDWDLLHAAAVTPGCKKCQNKNKSQHRKLTMHRWRRKFFRRSCWR